MRNLVSFPVLPEFDHSSLISFFSCLQEASLLDITDQACGLFDANEVQELYVSIYILINDFMDSSFIQMPFFKFYICLTLICFKHSSWTIR